MLKNYNRYRLIKVFLDSPTESFRLRELSRIVKIAPLSIMNYLKEFEKEGTVRRFEKRGIPFYQALRENERFILYKKISIIYELYDSGAVDFLWEKLAPDAIILYGSHVKGESIEGSDIDLFIVGKERAIDVMKFEKILGKRLHLMFEPDINEVSKELKNNIINGIILKGYLKVF